MSRKLTRLPASMLVRQNPGRWQPAFPAMWTRWKPCSPPASSAWRRTPAASCPSWRSFAVKNTGLALILLLVLPLFALFTRHVQKRMLAAQLDNRRAVAAVSGQVPETLHNIRTIRALGLEAYRERRYDRCIGDSYAAMERTNFYDAIYSPVVLVLNAVVVGAVMLLSASGNAAVLTLFGMSVGTSVAVINYISRIFAPIESLGMEIQTVQSAMAGVKRIDAFSPSRSGAAPAAGHGGPGDSPGEKHVLKDFSMTVKQGEQVTLMGRTGAGKSTVFRLLLGLYPPEAGTVTIGGCRCRTSPTGSAAPASAVWSSILPGVPGTVLDQITLGDPQITTKMAKHAAQLAGIDGPSKRCPTAATPRAVKDVLSGRVAAVVHRPSRRGGPAVLLLDEITANLDAETEARVLEACGGRRGSHGTVSVPQNLREPRRANCRNQKYYKLSLIFREKP